MPTSPRPPKWVGKGGLGEVTITMGRNSPRQRWQGRHSSKGARHKHTSGAEADRLQHVPPL
jgi:hypothetical protein